MKAKTVILLSCTAIFLGCFDFGTGSSTEENKNEQKEKVQEKVEETVEKVTEPVEKLINACGTKDIQALATQDDELVRGAAAWALGKIATPDARAALEKFSTSDPSESVRSEIQGALDRMQKN